MPLGAQLVITFHDKDEFVKVCCDHYDNHLEIVITKHDHKST